MVRRRRVLADGVGAVVAGATGSGWLAVERSSALRRRLHASGLLDGPDRPLPPEAAETKVDDATLDAPIRGACGPVRVDCGADDVFAGVSRRLLDLAPGIAGGIHPGFHDAGTWRSVLPAQLGWIRERVS